MQPITRLHERQLQSLFLRQTTVYIDLSKTLWHQQGTKQGLAAHLPIYKTTVNGQAMYYQLRPSAERFLKELHKRGYQLVVCTSGPKELRATVLEMMKLDHYFAAIIGREELFSARRNNKPMPATWVLVDDQDVFEFNARRKLTFLGLRSHCLSSKEILRSEEGKVCARKCAADYLVTCTAWRGGSKRHTRDSLVSLDGKDAAPLAQLVDVITRKLVKQYDKRSGNNNSKFKSSTNQ
jgi:predicted phosphatase